MNKKELISLKTILKKRKNNDYVQNMPKKGFKSFSLKDGVYDPYHSKFLENKIDLQKKGVTSFSAYLAYVLNEAIQQKSFHKNSKFEKIFMDSSSVVIKDLQLNEIFELSVKGNSLYCENDKRDDCLHVGFAYSIPEIYKNIQQSKKK